MYKPFVIQNFGGLNLSDNVTTVGAHEAVNMLNVDVTNGDIQCRPGTAKWNTSTPSSTGYEALFSNLDVNGPKILAVRRDGADDFQLETILPSTGVTSNVGTVALAGAWSVGSFAPLGTATTTLVYISLWGTAAGFSVIKYNSSAVTVAAGTGKPGFVATWPISNRLVQGHFFAAADSPTGADGGKSTVFFSDAGAPDTFGATNFVNLRPGDGEKITAMVTWRDLLFVFKQTNVFIFYGEDVDATGNPIFNYRRVSLVDGLSYAPGTSPTKPVAVASPEGVYFSTPGGIYLTSGGPPVRITDKIQGIFSRDPLVSSDIRLEETPTQPPWLSYCNPFLYGLYPTNSGTTRALVFDTRTARWMIWSLPTTAYTLVVSQTDQPGTSVGFPSEPFMIVNNDVHTMNPALTTDNGSSISWLYQSGRYTLADYGRVTVIPETSIVGASTASISVVIDSDIIVGTGGSVALGAYPTVSTEDWVPNGDQEGTNFGFTVSSAAAGLVNRITHYISNTKPTGVR